MLLLLLLLLLLFLFGAAAGGSCCCCYHSSSSGCAIGIGREWGVQGIIGERGAAAAAAAAAAAYRITHIELLLCADGGWCCIAVALVRYGSMYFWTNFGYTLCTKRIPMYKVRQWTYVIVSYLLPRVP